MWSYMGDIHELSLVDSKFQTPKKVFMSKDCTEAVWPEDLKIRKPRQKELQPSTGGCCAVSGLSFLSNL